MDESLSEVAGVLSGAALHPEAETPAPPDKVEPPGESLDSAIGEQDTAKLPAAAATAAETPAKLTVKALAEKLELRPQDLYQDLMIDVGAGEPLSLSALKDAGAKLHKAEKILSDAESHRQDAENELLRHQHAASTVPLTEEQVTEADESWKVYVREENAKSMGVISAWADNSQQRADLEDMSKILSGYGFRPAEIARLADHRYVKAFYDLMTYERRFKAVSESEVTKNPAPVGKAKRRSVTKPGAKAVAEFKAGRLTHSQAVAALIAEG